MAYEIFNGIFSSLHLNDTRHFRKEKVWVHLLVIQMLDGSASPVSWKYLNRCLKTHWSGCPVLLYSTSVAGSEVMGTLYPTEVVSSTPLIAAYTICKSVTCLWTTDINQGIGEWAEPLPKTGHQFHKAVGNVQQRRDCFTKNVSMPLLSGTNTVTGVLLYCHQLMKKLLQSKCQE